MAGRPRTFDVDGALDVALDVFWRRGYQATSVAQLTEQMGIHPPSLYAAFGDKHGLFEAAADRYVSLFRVGVAACLDAPTAHAAVADLLRAAAISQTDPATPPGCLVLSEPQLGDERARLRRSIADRIERGVEEGDTPADVDADRMAGFFLAVMIGMSARAHEGADRCELLATADAALAALPRT